MEVVTHAFGRTPVGKNARPGHKAGAVGPASAPEVELVTTDGLTPAVKPAPQLHAQFQRPVGGRSQVDGDDLVREAGKKLPPVLDISDGVREPGYAVAQVQAAPVIIAPLLVMAESEEGQVAQCLIGGL